MPFGEKQEHESYGLIGINNIQCSNGVSLFGSSIKHNRMIRLRISRAIVERNLSQEWFFGRETVIEIDLSSAQFAQFITTPNIGDGVPCTIRYVEGNKMEDPPYRGQNEIFNQELQTDFLKAMEGADSLISDADAMLESKGPLKVADKKILHNKLKMLVQHIKANMPFLHKQFTRSMDKTVVSAKAEIENFYTSTIMKMGKKALEESNKENQFLIEEDKEIEE